MISARNRLQPAEVLWRHASPRQALRDHRRAPAARDQTDGAGVGPEASHERLLRVMMGRCDEMHAIHGRDDTRSTEPNPLNDGIEARELA
jgi:hypothetical protein